MKVDRAQTLIAVGLLALLGATLSLLWPGIHGPFLFDDSPNLQNLRDLNGHLSRLSIGVYLSLFTGTPGRPLSALSFLINDFAWPSQPLGFKLTNLWIHLLNGVLVFGLARTLARAYGGPSLRADLIALVTAAIWLLNPIQISAVFLTVQRMAELVATAMFAGLWGFFALSMRARTALRACIAIALLGISTIAAYLCKENGALAPLLALITFATLLRSRIADLPVLPRRLLWAGVVLPSLAIGAMLVRIGLNARLGSYANRDFSVGERLMSQCRALLDYAGLIAMPRLSSSSLYNDDFAVSHGLLDPASTLPAVLALAAALAIGIAMRKRMPLLSFALLWFLGAHAIESSVVSLELYFEHRNYIPLFGPAFAIAMLAVRTQGKLRVPALAGLGAWLVLAGAILHLQARVWGNEALLATVWHVEHPNSLRAQQQYAIYLFDQGRLQEAHAVMANAAQQKVSPVDTSLQALMIECDAHRPIAPAEVARVSGLLQTERLAPGTAMMLARLRLSVQHGNCARSFPPESWLRLTDLALANPKGKGQIRTLRMERAELFLAANELDAAIHEMDRAYAGRRKEPRIAFYAAALLASAGRFDEARAWAQRPLAQPWSFKRWLAQTDEQAKELIAAIDQAQAEARARR